jgi:hypothetical protein
MSMDVLKGIILTIIVISHMIMIDRTNAATAVEGQEVGSLPVILQALYLGLMAYLILSGYFYRPRGFKNNMLKRLKQIGIPLVVASAILPLILWLYLNAFGYDLPISDYWSSALRNLGLYNLTGGMVTTSSYTFMNYGAYFLTGMLWGFLIFYGLAEYILDDWRKVFVIIIVLLCMQIIMVDYVPIKLPLMMKLGPIDAAFMFFGAWLAKWKFLENIEYGNKKETKYWLLPIVCLIAGVGLCYLLPPGIGYDMYKYGGYGSISIFPYFLESVLLFPVYAYIGFIFSKIPLVSNVFDLFGKHTLGTILMHPMVGKMLVVAFGFTLVNGGDIVPPGVPMWLRLTIAVLAIVIPVLICHYGPKLIERIKQGREAEKSEQTS